MFPTGLSRQTPTHARNIWDCLISENHRYTHGIVALQMVQKAIHECINYMRQGFTHHRTRALVQLMKFGQEAIPRGVGTLAQENLIPLDNRLVARLHQQLTENV